MLVYLGIDWSEQKHDVVFQNEKGEQILYVRIEHSLEGFLKLDQARQQLGISPLECVIGMETSHNLLVDFLWSRGYEQIYILPPKQVERSQGRRRQSGTRNDREDADLIAEMVRTDRHRLYPWQPGTPLLQEMRAQLGSVRFLTQEMVRLNNRLRAILLRYYPGILRAFSKLETQIALALIQSYPTPEAAAQMDFAAFQSFARQHHYTQIKKLATCYARWQAPYPPAMPAIVSAYQTEATYLANLLLQLMRLKKQQLAQLERLYQQHPDRLIFDSLPAAGPLLSAGLLVKFGEDRQRFPSPNLVQSLAGTCPATEQSGKHKYVYFRRACDQEFRYLAQEWARLTLNHSVWATDYFTRIRPHCRSDHHAYRCLANRWLEIVWKLWHDRTTYDETYHLQRRAQRLLPRA